MCNFFLRKLCRPQSILIERLDTQYQLKTRDFPFNSLYSLHGRRVDISRQDTVKSHLIEIDRGDIIFPIQFLAQRKKHSLS